MVSHLTLADRVIQCNQRRGFCRSRVLSAGRNSDQTLSTSEREAAIAAVDWRGSLLSQGATKRTCLCIVLLMHRAYWLLVSNLDHLSVIREYCRASTRQLCSSAMAVSLSSSSAQSFHMLLFFALSVSVLHSFSFFSLDRSPHLQSAGETIAQSPHSCVSPH
mmetsp:Transcript_7905/g.20935  ORF Transcript_7905/g.20935 Transcript_7905/m.20935 type:complete len:162 (+) Transcript_7905:489-974(+)